MDPATTSEFPLFSRRDLTADWIFFLVASLRLELEFWLLRELKIEDATNISSDGFILTRTSELAPVRESTDSK